jgi:hypothetical protein
MNTEEQKEINEHAYELCYQRIKFSSLWNSPQMKNNDQIDAKARDFATLLRLRLEELMEAAEIELEREAEQERAA